MPTTHNIHIIASDLDSGKLTFHPRGSSHARVEAGDTIRWHIRDDSEVDAIDSITAKIETDKIWSQEPRRTKGGHWEGVVKTTAKDDEFYLYLVKWTRGNHTRTHDPLISIRPSDFDHILNFILKSLPWIAIGGLATFLYGKKRRI